MEDRMADQAILETALKDMKSETKRRVPVYHQKTFDQALRDAEEGRCRFLRQLARTGGAAQKGDALQKLIEELVRKNPDLTRPELLANLRECQHRRHVIDDIDEDTIAFLNGEILKEVNVSGLKDRLSRAKRKSGSR